jgi:hypothetical protein
LFAGCFLVVSPNLQKIENNGKATPIPIVFGPQNICSHEEMALAHF